MTSPNPRPPHTVFETVLGEALRASVATVPPAAAGRRRLLQAAAADQRRYIRFWPQWFRHWFQRRAEPVMHIGVSGEAMLAWRLDWLMYSRQQLLR